MSNPLTQVTDLGGPAPIWTPDMNGDQYLSSSDYRHTAWGPGGWEKLNRNVCVNANSWVKMWMDWYQLQQDFVAIMGHVPQSRQESWDWMNTHDGPLLDGDPRIKRMDRQIKAANDDGRVVLLTVFQAHPTWASAGTDAQKTSDPQRYGRPVNAKMPDDVTLNSAWGWFIAYLIQRYKRGVPVNAQGPNDAVPYGNSTGAVIDLLEIVNEPNTEQWPQGNGWMACHVADMMKTAEEAAYAAGWNTSFQALLAPAANDKYSPWVSGEQPPPPDQNNQAQVTDFDRFAAGILNQLQNWMPRVGFGYSQHFYLDVEHWTNILNAEQTKTFESRVAATHDRLIHSTWKGSTIDGNVWLTEGGYRKRGDTSKGPTQDSMDRANFNRMKGAGYPYVPIWTTFSVIDIAPDIAKAGMRDGTKDANGVVTLGTQYPLQNSWVNHMQ
jgi:hypothetical protein